MAMTDPALFGSRHDFIWLASSEFMFQKQMLLIWWVAHESREESNT